MGEIELRFDDPMPGFVDIAVEQGVPAPDSCEGESLRKHRDLLKSRFNNKASGLVDEAPALNISGAQHFSAGFAGWEPALSQRLDLPGIQSPSKPLYLHGDLPECGPR